MRLFTAVTLGDTVESRTAARMEELRVLAPRARWVKVEGLHLTLVFLGDVEDARLPAIQEALTPVGARHAPFALSVEGGGAFGAPAHPRVLWADVRGATDALKALQADTAQVLQPLGFEPEHREYTAHLTLARAREPRGDPALASCVQALSQATLGDARVERLILFESKGGHYLHRLEVPLSRGLG
ncbi:RNA 2',3'-cyclic phosphodiesterase [Comamonas sp. JC664]|uniref:RNA 2',3'-cyclic phosphodiesterase n=1 Tax=Comamonas sp. JC664 TaxID=2801917 RepID=UPI00174D0D1F|nr:RNA 2',3'-cyclic phosphodiesterase [Comamonas sp. JC664]MBL0694933.1 RNA 2',3'-cyclic phosphodiesterase [Comamonas sp. JC664]GHG95346.1 RNA 2',3'-cyclic phosphodiesterase [Comamonas sp. KCTC 72670]